MTFNPEIFRANDIRGIYGLDFNNDFAFRLGFALVKYLKRPKFIVACDERNFSPELRKSLVGGMISAGGDVFDLDSATLPFFNFALNKLQADGGVMITASHNPPEYGGFKVFGEEGRIIGLNNGLDSIRGMMLKEFNDDAAVSKYGGKIYELDKQLLLQKYSDFIYDKAKIARDALVGIKIKFAASPMAEKEARVIIKKANLTVNNIDFQIGFAFDEDSDRIDVFNEAGKPIPSDYIFGMLAEEMIGCFLKPKPKIVYDLRLSRGVLEKFNKLGIKVTRSKVGRAFIKREMAECKADIGGELSGHIFFKEAHYNELPLLAMLKILRIMVKSGEGIDKLIEPFQTWHNSGEINMEARDKKQATNILAGLKERHGDGKIDELDGITVEYDDWWFNLRPSNTEPLLRLVVEAKTEKLLKNKTDELLEIIKTAQQAAW